MLKIAELQIQHQCVRSQIIEFVLRRQEEEANRYLAVSKV
ncbi:Uncharacterised protein [uncultured Clostridium sp.]|nr:Uncharacterised protein [uncultured Clostridium sp.]